MSCIVANPALKYLTLDTAPHEAHQLVLQLVAGAGRVLEVGAATGYMSKAMSAQGTQVVAVELDPVAAAQARVLDIDIRVGPVEQVIDAGEQFDCVVLADVLEHVADGDTFLARCRRHLRPEGSVVLSVPNVAHWSLRWSLCRGRFDYTPVGLLDDTHLRFYTAQTLEKLLARHGLRVVDKRYSLGAYTYRRWRSQTVRRCRNCLIRTAVALKPELFAYQFVWKAVAS